MKKLAAAVLTLLLLALSLSGCASEKTLTLNVYNWGE